MLTAQGKVLAVLETTAGEDDREIVVVVGVGVAHAGAVEDGGVVEKRAPRIIGSGQAVKESGEFTELGFFDETKLGKFLRLIAMVGERMGAGFDTGNVGLHGVLMDVNRDQTRRVGLDGELGQVIHGTGALDEGAGVAEVLGWFDRNFGFGFLFPFLTLAETVFEFADTGEELIESVAVRGADLAVELLGAFADRVEDAAALAELVHLGFDFFGGALDEELAEKVRRGIVARYLDAGLGVGKTLFRSDADGKRREARVVADALGSVLVDGNGVAEAAASGMRRGRQEAVFGLMAAVDFRVGHPRENSQLIPVRGKDVEVGGGLVVTAPALGEEVVREDALIGFDRDEALRGYSWRRTSGGARRHGFEERKGDGGAGGAEEGAAVDGFVHGGRCVGTGI